MQSVNSRGWVRCILYETPVSFPQSSAKIVRPPPFVSRARAARKTSSHDGLF
jgi:hypothetical protein